MKNRIWKDFERYISIIEEEIRQPDPDFIAIDFYCFKIRRRVKILKDYLDAEIHKDIS
jgi:hypothetical protein